MVFGLKVDDLMMGFMGLGCLMISFLLGKR
jgi:hypothetical protein